MSPRPITAPTAEVLPPFPPGDPRWRELAFLRMGPPGDRVWRRMDKFGTRARRAGTAESPLAFAYVYLSKTLKPVQPLTPDGDPVPARCPWCRSPTSTSHCARRRRTG
jgi:hypothetical protein